MQSNNYSYTSTCPLSPIIKGLDFFTFLLELALFYVPFCDPSYP